MIKHSKLKGSNDMNLDEDYYNHLNGAGVRYKIKDTQPETRSKKMLGTRYAFKFIYAARSSEIAMKSTIIKDYRDSQADFACIRSSPNLGCLIIFLEANTNRSLGGHVPPVHAHITLQLNRCACKVDGDQSINVSQMQKRGRTR